MGFFTESLQTVCIMYRNPLSEKVYSKLNKNRSINRFFNQKSVGKCMELINDYYHSTKNFCKLGWENYYLTEKRTKRLNEIYLILREKHQDVLAVDLSDFIFLRVIAQTYNGFLTELNIIKILQENFPKLYFERTTNDLDANYFTDFQTYTNGKLVFGGQIKPISYKYMSTSYQLKQKKNHQIQKEAYIKLFKVPHMLLYYDNNDLYDKQKVFNKINIILTFKNKE